MTLLSLLASLALFASPCAPPTGHNMTILVGPDSTSLEVGDVVSAYVDRDGQPLCVGRAEVPASGGFAIAIWGGEGPYQDSGASPGEQISLRVDTRGIGASGRFYDFTSGSPLGAYDSVVYGTDRLYVASSLGAIVMASSIGFSSDTLRAPQNTEVWADVSVVHSGSSKLSGIQLDMSGPITDVQLGPGMAGFTLSTSETGADSTRAITLNTSGGLDAGTHIVLRVKVSVGQGAVVRLFNPIGTLDDASGTDANMTLGIAQATFVVDVLGDADGDGDFELDDFVDAIDMALGTIPYASGSDVYPFGAPDGSVDVRDLNVLGRALAASRFPDGRPVIGSALRTEAVTAIASLLNGIYQIEFSEDIRAIRGRLVADALGVANGSTLILGEDSRFVAYAMASQMARPVLTAKTTESNLQDAQLEVALTNGTTQVVTVSLQATSGGEEPTLPESLVIYPNPTTGRVTFTQAITGRLFDSLGREVLDFKEADTLDLSHLSVGTYTIVLDSGDARRIALVR